MRTKQYTSGDVWRRMPRPVAVSRSACARVLGSRTFALWYRVLGVVSHRLAQQRLERGLVNLVSLAKVYRPPHVFPSRPALKSFLGSGSSAPWKNVSFTLSLWAFARAYIPSRDQTGVPIHFHSSTTSGSTSWMSVRISANLSPLQSLKSAIFLSIRLDALIWSDDLAAALRGLAAFAATRLAAAFFATFADFLDVLPAIVFTPGLLRRCATRGATWWHTAARTSTDR